MRVAVVGHVEWVEFARVSEVPRPGQIVHATETWAVPAGGGAVAAVQLAKLAGNATFYTALGDDEVGHRAHEGLVALGLSVEVGWRAEPQRRAFTYVDDAGERTITVIGSRLGPDRRDPLPWEELALADAVYFTAGDPSALRTARAARCLIATMRASETLRTAGVTLDVLVSSARDPDERYDSGSILPAPRRVIRTAGPAGGAWEATDGSAGSWEAAPVPGPVADSYGCGDSFAGGLTFGLARGMGFEDAVELGALCGSWCLTGRGPYERQLSAADLEATAAASEG